MCMSSEKRYCKCGCGTEVKKNWVRGHISRVKNPRTEEGTRKSIEKRKQLSAEGKLVAWNKGLTKETDDRVRLYGITSSKNFNQERKDRYSRIMRKNRLDGTVPTLRGKDHSQWKGGTSSINALVRQRKRLYEGWTYPILVRDGFKCTQCESTKNLEVHHDGETMADIIGQFTNPDKEHTFEEKDMIAEKVIDYHIQMNISGKTLCKKCHTEEHPFYNF